MPVRCCPPPSLSPFRLPAIACALVFGLALPRAGATEPAADPMALLKVRLQEKLGAVKAPAAAGRHDLQVPARVPKAGKLPDAKGLAAAHRAKQPRAHDAHAHWTYSGETGPAQWGGLKPEYALCAEGRRQSPIDIRDGIAVDLAPVRFDYRAGGFAVIDNGHTVQVDVARGSTIEVMGRRYELQRFEFRRPGEERVDGRQSEMSLHLVHRDAEGRLAVVAVPLERGAGLPAVQQVWNNLPLEKGEPLRAQETLDPAGLLPADQRYYTYMGSLTTPPCTEGVLWMVMQQSVTLSPQQIDIFARLYPMNARPVQAAAGRLIKQSN